MSDEYMMYRDNVTCPFCSYENRDSWEISDGEHDCHRCGETMIVERDVSVTYSTSKPRAPVDRTAMHK